MALGRRLRGPRERRRPWQAAPAVEVVAAVGQVWSHAGEGHSRPVPCQRQGAPVLEKAAASSNHAGEGERRGTPQRLCELKLSMSFFF